MRKNYSLQLNSLAESAPSLLSSFSTQKIFAFHGELGAGKTTFIKALCKELGVNENMSSPSFALVNEYRDQKNNPVYHLDLYRLKSEREALDIGLEEYLDSGNYCFIEWPEIIEHLLPEETVHVYIEILGEKRTISVKKS